MPHDLPTQEPCANASFSSDEPQFPAASPGQAAAVPVALLEQVRRAGEDEGYALLRDWSLREACRRNVAYDRQLEFCKEVLDACRGYFRYLWDEEALQRVSRYWLRMCRQRAAASMAYDSLPIDTVQPAPPQPRQPHPSEPHPPYFAPGRGIDAEELMRHAPSLTGSLSAHLAHALGRKVATFDCASFFGSAMGLEGHPRVLRLDNSWNLNQFLPKFITLTVEAQVLSCEGGAPQARKCASLIFEKSPGELYSPHYWTRGRVDTGLLDGVRPLLADFRQQCLGSPAGVAPGRSTWAILP